MTKSMKVNLKQKPEYLGLPMVKSAWSYVQLSPRGSGLWNIDGQCHLNLSRTLA